MSTAPHSSPRDFLLGTLVAALMAAAFAAFGPGHALLVTFVPGVAFAWVLFVGFTRRPLPPAGRIVAPYAAALTVQALHVAEELHWNFHERFPPLYGGAPFGAGSFVALNVLAWGLFAAAGYGAFVRRVPVLLIPALFFIGYGSVGNSIAHVTWSALHRAYFPGLVSGLAHGVLGIVLLARVLESPARAALHWVVFAGLLSTLLVGPALTG